ncbi:hypothetical protein HK097_010403, partial [Rhizophlyctis rosea]
MSAAPTHRGFANVPARTDSGFDRIRLTLHQKYREKTRGKASKSSRHPPQLPSRNINQYLDPNIPAANDLIHQVSIISDALRSLESGIGSNAETGNGYIPAEEIYQNKAGKADAIVEGRDGLAQSEAQSKIAPPVVSHPVNASSIFGRMGDLESTRGASADPSKEHTQAPEVEVPDFTPAAHIPISTSPSKVSEMVRPPTPTSPIPPATYSSPIDNASKIHLEPAQSHPFLFPNEYPPTKAPDFKSSPPQPTSSEKKKRRKGSNSSSSNPDAEKVRYYLQAQAHLPPLDAFRRRIRFLENENVCIKAELENRCSADSQTIKALHSRVRALETENRNMKAEAGDNGAVAFLRTKVTHLEKESEKLKKVVEESRNDKGEEALVEMTGRCEVLQNDVHDLQMRLSRQNMELKSLLEQNSILRKENKRLIEQEGILKKKLLASEVEGLIKDKSRAASPQHDIGRCMTPVEREGMERLSVLVENEIRSLEEKGHEMAVAQRRADRSIAHTVDWLSSGLFQAPHLIEGMVKSLKHLKESMANGTEPQNQHRHQILTVGSEILHTVSTCAKAIQSVWKESSELDARIHRIREDSVKIRQEAEETIEDLTNQYAEDVRALEKGNRALEANLVAMRGELDKIHTKYVEERRTLNEKISVLQQHCQHVDQRNHNLESHIQPMEEEIARLREVERVSKETERDLEYRYKLEQKDMEHHSATIEHEASTAVMDAERRIKDLTRQLDAVTEDNIKFKSQIDCLERQIGEWKTENATLKDTLGKREALPIETGEGIIKLQSTIAKLQTKIEDEKLKNRKAAELIGSLNEGIARSKEEVERLKVSERKLLDDVENQKTLRELEDAVREKVGRGKG